MRNDWEKLMKDKLDSSSLDELLPGFELDLWQGIESKLEPVKEKRSNRRWLTHIAAAIGGLLIGFTIFKFGGAGESKMVVANNPATVKTVVENDKSASVSVTTPVVAIANDNVAAVKSAHQKIIRFKKPVPTKCEEVREENKTVEPVVVSAINHGRAVHIADLDAADDANKVIANARQNVNTQQGRGVAQLNRSGKAVHLMDMNEDYRALAEGRDKNKPSQNAIRNLATREMNKAAGRDPLTGAAPPLRNMFKEVIP